MFTLKTYRVLINLGIVIMPRGSILVPLLFMFMSLRVLKVKSHKILIRFARKLSAFVIYMRKELSLILFKIPSVLY